MTDARGDRSLRPSRQPVADTYVHVIERHADGIVISGTKAIVTAAPYMVRRHVRVGQHNVVVERAPDRQRPALHVDQAHAVAGGVDHFDLREPRGHGRQRGSAFGFHPNPCR